MSDIERVEYYKHLFGINQGDRIVLWTGNMSRWSGIDTLITAGIQILDLGESMKFILVGDGSEKNKFKGMIPIQHKDSFILSDSLPHTQIPYVISCSHLCVAPISGSITSTKPIKIYEYLSCCRPVIASRIPGLEFIEEYCLGKLIEPDNPSALAEGIIELFDDYLLLYTMGQRGRRYVKQFCEWDKSSEKIEQVLLNLTKDG